MTSPADGTLAASVHARCAEKYAVETTARRHRVLADEPASRGGMDGAATPMEILAAGLAACTAITLRMYAERKNWELGEVKVDCRVVEQDGAYRVERTIRIGAALEEDRRARLAEIAEKTPVTRLVKQGAAIRTVMS